MSETIVSPVDRPAAITAGNLIKSVVAAMFLASSLTACGVDEGDRGEPAAESSAISEIGVGVPVPANAHTCGAFCFFVEGGGNRVDRAGADLPHDDRVFIVNSGHLEVRWHAGGVDHFRNTSETSINNQNIITWLDMHVIVDPNTFVCGRWWHWNGTSWILPYGDWRCIKTHP
jgi:hypothetical protein